MHPHISALSLCPRVAAVEFSRHVPSSVLAVMVLLESRLDRFKPTPMWLQTVERLLTRVPPMVAQFPPVVVRMIPVMWAPILVVALLAWQDGHPRPQLAVVVTHSAIVPVLEIPSEVLLEFLESAFLLPLRMIPTREPHSRLPPLRVFPMASALFPIAAALLAPEQPAPAGTSMPKPSPLVPSVARWVITIPLGPDVKHLCAQAMLLRPNAMLVPFPSRPRLWWHLAMAALPNLQLRQTLF